MPRGRPRGARDVATRPTFAAAAGALALLAGCATPAVRAPAPREYRAAEHPGVWASNGYGYVFDVSRGRARAFHAAGDLCVAEPEGESSLVSAFDLYRPADGGRTLWLSSRLDPYEYEFRRAPALPGACLAPPTDTPLGNFDAFAAFFARHYAFFDLYGVDWAARVARARPGVHEGMSDEELFRAMVELVRPLKDAHIKVEAELDRRSAVYDGNPGKTEHAAVEWGRRRGLDAKDALRQFRRHYWFEDVGRAVLGGEGVVAANGRIQYGLAAPGVGYVAVVSMGGFVDGSESSERAELPALDRAMDAALGLFRQRGVGAVILDLSFNTGGYDFVGLALAGRFVAERAIAFRRRPGDAPGARGSVLYVEPSRSARFEGPVYVVTSDQTVSAAEIAVLGLRSLPNVTVAGEKTRGALSTVLTKYLPNGWELSLSNEIYTDRRGVLWEGRGIEPDLPLPIFRPDDPTAGHAEAVRALVATVDARRRAGPSGAKAK